jgi:hypothetical protein
MTKQEQIHEIIKDLEPLERADILSKMCLGNLFAAQIPPTLVRLFFEGSIQEFGNSEELSWAYSSLAIYNKWDLEPVKEH